MKWLSLLFLVLLSCQNPYVAPPPNTGGVVIAVGANGSIARSTDRGETWETSMANPNLPPSKVILGNKTFAGLVTFQQQPVMPSNQQSVNTSAAAGTIGSAANPYFGDEYIRGTYYQQLGQNWVGPIANPVANATCITYDSVNMAYVIAGLAGQMTRSTTNGASWSALVANPFGASVIRSLTSGAGVIVAGAYSGKLARSTDGGTTWSGLLATPFGADNIYLVLYGKINGVDVFLAATVTGKISISNDLGVTWSGAIANPFGGGTIAGGASGNNVFVLGGSAGFARSTDGGNTWGSLLTTPLTQGFTATFGNGVFLIGGGTALVSQLARSVDNGVTWGSLITQPFAGVCQIYSSGYAFGVFYIGSTLGAFARSYDNGLTWGNTITNPCGATEVIYGISSSPVNITMAGGNGTIATAGWNAVYSINNPTGDNDLGVFIHFLLNNVTSRRAVNSAALPAAGFWSAAVQITGNFGVPPGAKAILADVRSELQTNAVANGEGNFSFSDNIASVPSIVTAHPNFDHFYTGAIISENDYLEKEMIIPLNSSGQFYVYAITINNLSVANYSLVVKGYSMG